ncbi:hypothetical protein [Saccharopolyspora sp. CA-218241]|uniref:hypothetical protein n=1 Tax=Saccharopolyspora sp. CA-218241 TaxID=3240027 RepID=UPI003D988538
MAAAVRVATLPFRALYRLVKLLLLPVLAGAVAVWVAWLGVDWMLWLAALAGVWAAVMVRLWWVQVLGELRSLGRGTVHVRAGARGGRR